MFPESSAARGPSWRAEPDSNRAWPFWNQVMFTWWKVQIAVQDGVMMSCVLRWLLATELLIVAMVPETQFTLYLMEDEGGDGREKRGGGVWEKRGEKGEVMGVRREGRGGERMRRGKQWGRVRKMKEESGCCWPPSRIGTWPRLPSKHWWSEVHCSSSCLPDICNRACRSWSCCHRQCFALKDQMVLTPADSDDLYLKLLFHAKWRIWLEWRCRGGWQWNLSPVSSSKKIHVLTISAVFCSEVFLPVFRLKSFCSLFHFYFPNQSNDITVCASDVSSFQITWHMTLNTNLSCCFHTGHSFNWSLEP